MEQGILVLKNDIENQNFEIFGEFVNNFGTIYHTVKIYFDQWSKLYFYFDAQPEIQILIWL